MKQKKPFDKIPVRHFGGIIFDIDNVLIDTRESYLETIRWTIEIYLTWGKVPLFEPAPKKMRPAILSPEEVEQFKLLGGFNDDWDCCYGLLVYLLSLKPKSRSALDLKKAIDLKAFSREIVDRPLGVNGIVKKLGRSQFVMIEKIARIFQEIYLGPELFIRLEKKKPAYWLKKGLLQKEKLIFRISTLQRLKDNGFKLGIATGRPRFEAAYALKHLGILDFFTAMTTADEVKKEEQEKKQSMRKPHPFSVLETAKKLQCAEGLIYLGDLPDDIVAANRAKEFIDIKSAALMTMAANKAAALAEIKKHHPDFILDKPGDLGKIVK